MHVRAVLPALIAAALTLCLLPSAALASTWWPEKNAGGRTIAYAKVWSTGRGVSDVAKRNFGSWDSYNVHVKKLGTGKWTAWMGVSGLIAVDVVSRADTLPWRIQSHSSGKLAGRILHRNGRWVIQGYRGGAYKTIGSVNDGCRRWLAGGATYVEMSGRGW